MNFQSQELQNLGLTPEQHQQEEGESKYQHRTEYETTEPLPCNI